MKNTISRWQLAAPDQLRMSSSALLLATLDWANQQGFWQPFNRLMSVAMKTVTYSPVQKLQTLVASIVLGCQYNRDINLRLVPDRPAASLLGMTRFPDQSQVNLLLRRLDRTNLDELKLVHLEQLVQHAHLPNSPFGQHHQVVIDIDQCGLVASGKSYQLSRKGYFPRRRGQKGYQFALAYLSPQQLSVTMRLAPGNTHCSTQMRGLVEESEQRLALMGAQRDEIIYRMDAGYGSLEAAAWLHLQGYRFVVKAATNYAHKWVGNIAAQTWLDFPGQPNAEVAEAGQREGLRVVACRIQTRQGWEYCLLLTNLSVAQYDAIALWQFYNQRQTIEAFFKSGRQIYGLSNLRSREINAITGFIWLLCISHNLLVWVKHDLFSSGAGTKLGTGELVRKLGQVQVEAEPSASGWRLVLPRFNALSRLFMAAFANQWEQLPLRLYET